jgi:hypothetical protein
MTAKRLFLALPALALLAACSDDAPADDGRSASGEVLEGTISDAMLPLDRVQSEPPLEDPEAFAEAQSEAADAQAEAAPDAEEAEAEAAEPEAAPVPEPVPEPEG